MIKSASSIKFEGFHVFGDLSGQRSPVHTVYNSGKLTIISGKLTSDTFAVEAWTYLSLGRHSGSIEMRLIKSIFAAIRRVFAGNSTLAAIFFGS